jgi:RimJ/RimL family protein N-acetyltransferase
MASRRPDQLRGASTCCTWAVISLPLTTARLSIRMMRVQHTQRLVEYRNHREVVRHQGWEVPFTIEMGEQLIAEQAHLEGPIDESWVQLAVELRSEERGSETIGDIAVRIHDNGRQATIGYTIAADAQGNGYATEAATAVVDALFEDADVHRIVASTDPENIASRRVLEKIGFRFEGRSPSSVFVHGQWVDDDRFALLASEHADRIRPADDRA